MKKVKYISLLILAILMSYALIQFNHKTKFKSIDNELINYDVYQQLQYLKANKNLDISMQSYYPEGYFFSNAIYLLTWVNTIKHLPKSHSIYKEGIPEIKGALINLESNFSKNNFYNNGPLQHGAFYNGWLGYCLGEYLKLENNEGQLMKLDSLCTDMKNAIDTSRCGFIESYDGSIWSGDNISCIAAMKNYDAVSKSNKFNTFIKSWLDKNVVTSLKKNELLFHFMDMSTCRKTKFRGCSSTLFNVFLFEIDTTLSKKYYTVLKNSFLNKSLLRYGFREYLEGEKGEGDIDSGPVIWDIGAVASIVGMRAALLHNDKKVYKDLMRSIEFFGIPFTSNNQKRYIFGKVYMADLFIAWSKSSEIPPK